MSQALLVTGQWGSLERGCVLCWWFAFLKNGLEEAFLCSFRVSEVSVSLWLGGSDSRKQTRLRVDQHCLGTVTIAALTAEEHDDLAICVSRITYSLSLNIPGIYGWEKVISIDRMLETLYSAQQRVSLGVLNQANNLETRIREYWSAVLLRQPHANYHQLSKGFLDCGKV